MLPLLTMLLTGLAATALEAQSARLLGRVTDSLGRPLRDAAVMLEREDAAAPAASTTSGATGGYQFRDVPPGIYHLHAVRPGYRDDDLRVRVQEGLVVVPVIRLPAGGRVAAPR
jgi:protocatechuate 3,4-dioxygenase beta subunit